MSTHTPKSVLAGLIGGFALVGALFIVPFILMYTAWSYYVFRGKVRPGAGYH